MTRSSAAMCLMDRGEWQTWRTCREELRNIVLPRSTLWPSKTLAELSPSGIFLVCTILRTTGHKCWMETSWMSLSCANNVIYIVTYFSSHCDGWHYIHRCSAHLVCLIPDVLRFLLCISGLISHSENFSLIPCLFSWCCGKLMTHPLFSDIHSPHPCRL